MKKLWLLVALTVLVAFTLAGCGGSGNKPGSSKTGSLVLNIGQAGLKAQTIEPVLDMNIAAYDIIGSGPNGANFRKDNVTVGGQVRINTLGVGSWAVEVDAKNAAGILIAAGVTTVQVSAGAAAQAIVTVRPINGTGQLNLTVSWPAGIIMNPSVTGTLIPVGGTALNITYTLSGDNLSATYQNSMLSTGYYTLFTQLKDGSTRKWSATDTIRIINGQTTTGVYELTATQGQFGDIQLEVTPDLQNPITITFSGQQNSLPAGSDMTITAAPSQPVDAYQWYLNGFALPDATNASLTIGQSLGVGKYMLTLVITKGNIVSSNSIGFSVEASDPSPPPVPTPTPIPALDDNLFYFNLTYTGPNPFDANHPIYLVLYDFTNQVPAAAYIKATQNGSYTVDKSTLTPAYNPMNSYALAIVHDLNNDINQTGFVGPDDVYCLYYDNGANNVSLSRYTFINPGVIYEFNVDNSVTSGMELTIF
ncbi:MAG TPA: hypothetical protein VHY08_12815 [Bacillota bacterium]|nr:hypothetical protein [Bacillota bacterium]